jgi:hypothetical protein
MRKVFAPRRAARLACCAGRRPCTKEWAAMVTFDSSVFWLVPPVLAVAFMLWALCMFWHDGSRHHSR